MNLALTFNILGGLLMFLGGTLLVPIPISLMYGDGAYDAFLVSAILALALGAMFYHGLPAEEEMSFREGFGIVTIGWIFFGVFGALPYILTGSLPGFLDAFFESMSGFTTTGATVITDLTRIPESVLFWRSETQWLGGMGIIVLTLAILPFLGVGGMQLFNAEVPGPTKEKLTSRIQDAAKMLWGVYVLLTLALFLLLTMGGMTTFDAVCHAFTTMSTGGFSTQNASLGAWESPFIQWVVTIFMILAAVNFTLHFYALRGDFRVFLASDEMKFFLFTVLACTGLISGLTWNSELGAERTIRDAAFQVASISSSTGFGTADYEAWPAVAQFLMLTLMVMGGCAGSTAGGAKVARVVLILKHSTIQVFKLIHPKGVRFLRIDRKAVSPDVIQSILAFTILYVLVFFAASFLLTLSGADLVTATSSAISALSNIGPALGTAGPTENYHHFSEFGKFTLAICMLIGRLEFFTVVVLFLPSFWRK